MPDIQAAILRAGERTDLLYPGLFALAYFIGAELGYAVSLGPSVGGTFWPPAGIALAAFLAAPRRMWPYLLVAGAFANFVSDQVHGQTLAASIAFIITNLSEPVIGALVLRQVFAAPVTFTRLPEIIALAVVVVLVSAPVAAAIGAVAAEWWTQDPPGLLAGWRTWWVGDAVGALVLTPAVFRLVTDYRRFVTVPAHRWLEAMSFAVVVVAVTHIVFTSPPTTLAMPFLVFPVLLWGSLRFGPIGVGGALCLVVLLTAIDTADGKGPFAADQLSLGGRLIALQIYVGVMALTFHGLGVLWEERSRTAAALRLAHSGLSARYRRIVEQSPLGILAIDPDGGLQEINPAWRQLWRRPGTDADVGPWEDPQLKPLLQRAFTGDIVELPERSIGVPTDSGPPHRRVHGVAYPVKDDSGRVTEVVLIARDITEELEAQQKLLDANRTLREREEALSQLLEQMAEAQAHRQELLEAERYARGEAERASQLKEEFLATLSHELRSPLNAIVGWTHVLRQSLSGSELAPAVETIERNALAQAKLIDDLLDMSRIMNGKVGLTLARANLAEIVTTAADTLQPIAAAKGVSLCVDVAGAANVPISCDAARLQQVVTNLLGNGIKFTPAGGRVDAEITVRDEDVQLVVRDTGQGIPGELTSAIFERFRQADGSTTRHHGGLGLGLSIAKQIVEMHGGSISAQSDGDGRGAAFTVTLPLALGGHTLDLAASDEVQAERLSGLRVLVVDDEADARDVLSRLLAERGCEVTTAGSAEEALALLAAAPCDVLLTDIGMPGKDGYELLRRVRATHGARKAIAVTAFARPEDRARSLEAGFDGHLAKPVNPVRLSRMLAEIAEIRSQVTGPEFETP